MSETKTSKDSTFFFGFAAGAIIGSLTGSLMLSFRLKSSEQVYKEAIERGFLYILKAKYGKLRQPTCVW